MTAKMAAVANLAGVSESTVSKVLNSRPGISAETRDKVLRACKELGYEFRQRKARPSAPVEVVVSGVEPELREILLASMLEVFELAKRPMVVQPALGGWEEALIGRQPAAVVLATIPLNKELLVRLGESGVPAVAVNLGDEADSGPDMVGCTQWRGGYLAVEHLVECGHERIGIFAGPQGSAASFARLSGALAALPVGSLVGEPVHLPWDERASRLAAMELLKCQSLTAIATGDDRQAAGVIAAARALCIRVPEQLSVVGFGDLRIATSFMPRLTTIRQPIDRMAKEAGRMALELIGNPGLEATGMNLATRLVIRESTAKLRR
jgi:DNA-binding LacI/PurR family transcriptional regulator